MQQFNEKEHVKKKACEKKHVKKPGKEAFNRMIQQVYNIQLKSCRYLCNNYSQDYAFLIASKKEKKP